MRFFLFSITILLSFLCFAPAEASKFRLKNMPAEHAMLEGAIVNKENQTIVIMTKTGLTIRSLESIEILEETPIDDKEFIATYGPNNMEYQKYAFPEKFIVVEKKDSFTFGHKSIAEPGRKYELKPQFTAKQLEYTIADATYSLDLKDQKRNDNKYLMSFLVKIVHSSYITRVDRRGNATMKIHNDDLGLTLFVNDRKFRIPSWMLGKKDETETVQISANGEIEGEDQSYDPENIFDSPTEFMQDISRDLFFKLPDQPVAVGDTWGKTREYVDDDTGELSIVDLNITFLDLVEIDEEPVAILSADFDIDTSEFVLESFAEDLEESPFEDDEKIEAKQLNLRHNSITYFHMTKKKSVYNKESISFFGVLEGIKDNETVNDGFGFGIGSHHYRHGSKTTETILMVQVFRGNNRTDSTAFVEIAFDFHPTRLAGIH